MKSAFTRVICRFLVVSLLALSLGSANAGMVGIDPPSTSLSDRAAVMSFMERSDVASALQARGVDAQAARERVDAMTDAEIRALKGRIDELPAGAMLGGPAVMTAAILIAFVTLIVAALLSGR